MSSDVIPLPSGYAIKPFTLMKIITNAQDLIYFHTVYIQYLFSNTY